VPQRSRSLLLRAVGTGCRPVVADLNELAHTLNEQHHVAEGYDMQC